MQTVTKAFDSGFQPFAGLGLAASTWYNDRADIAGKAEAAIKRDGLIGKEVKEPTSCEIKVADKTPLDHGAPTIVAGVFEAGSAGQPAQSQGAGIVDSSPVTAHAGISLDGTAGALADNPKAPGAPSVGVTHPHATPPPAPPGGNPPVAPAAQPPAAAPGGGQDAQGPPFHHIVPAQPPRPVYRAGVPDPKTFEEWVKTVDPGVRVAAFHGTHLHPRLAFLRWYMERIAFERIHKDGHRFILSVGGNASREEKALVGDSAVHFCNPVLSPSDIERDRRGGSQCSCPFPDCTHMGPATCAFASYVFDLDADTIHAGLGKGQLTCMYALVHSFKPGSSGLHESEVVVRPNFNGGTVHMRTAGGSSYMHRDCWEYRAHENTGIIRTRGGPLSIHLLEDFQGTQLLKIVRLPANALTAAFGVTYTSNPYESVRWVGSCKVHVPDWYDTDHYTVLTSNGVGYRVHSDVINAGAFVAMGAVENTFAIATAINNKTVQLSGGRPPPDVLAALILLSQEAAREMANALQSNDLGPLSRAKQRMANYWQHLDHNARRMASTLAVMALLLALLVASTVSVYHLKTAPSPLLERRLACSTWIRSACIPYEAYPYQAPTPFTAFPGSEQLEAYQDAVWRGLNAHDKPTALLAAWFAIVEEFLVWWCGPYIALAFPVADFLYHRTFAAFTAATLFHSAMAVVRHNSPLASAGIHIAINAVGFTFGGMGAAVSWYLPVAGAVHAGWQAHRHESNLRAELGPNATMTEPEILREDKHLAVEPLGIVYPAVRPRVAALSTKNEIAALTSRLLNPISGDGDCRETNDRFFDAMERLHASMPQVKRQSFLAWASKFPANVRAQLHRAHKEVQGGRTSKAWLRSKAFVKWELMLSNKDLAPIYDAGNNWPKNFESDYKPRLIESMSPHFNAVVGPESRAYQKSMNHAFTRHGEFFYAGGVAREEIAAWYEETERDIPDGQWLDLDRSRYDSTQRFKLRLLWLVSARRHGWFRGRSGHYYAAVNAHHAGVTRSGVEYTDSGKQHTGSPTTSSGNTVYGVACQIALLRNAMTAQQRREHDLWCAGLGGRPYYKIAAQGDDLIAKISREVFANGYHPEQEKVFGLEPKANLHNDGTALRFLSSTFVPVKPYLWDGQIVSTLLIPLIARQAFKCGWNKDPQLGVEKFRGEMMSHLNDWSAVPILRVIRSRTLELLGEGRAVLPKKLEHRAGAALSHDATAATFGHVAAFYGTSVGALEELEAQIASVQSLPAFLNAPVLLHMLGVDL